MKLDRLKYGKSTGKREWEEPENKVPDFIPNSHIIPQALSFLSGYTKAEGAIDVRIIFILSGGVIGCLIDL